MAATVGIGTAGAATQVIVNLPTCYFQDGGNATVPAGTEVVFRIGWADKNKGFVQNFLKSQQVTATVDGNSVPNASSLYGPIEKVDKKFYLSVWRFSAGTLANPGDSTHIDFQSTITKSVPATDEDGNVSKLETGPLFPPDFGCTVTAV